MSVYTEEDMTPWFPGSVSPEREGVYEREYADDDDGSGDSQRFAMFTQGEWKIGNGTVKLAAEQTSRSLYKVGDDVFVWRGLKADVVLRKDLLALRELALDAAAEALGEVVTITPEVAVVKCDAPGLALDSGEFIPAAELNAQAVVDDEEDLF